MGSKGGHSNKESSPFKTMVNFNGSIIDVFSIQGIDKKNLVDNKSEFGFSYGIEIMTSDFNRNKVFKYSDEERRDDEYDKLKVKLISVGVLII